MMDHSGTVNQDIHGPELLSEHPVETVDAIADSQVCPKRQGAGMEQRLRDGLAESRPIPSGGAYGSAVLCQGNHNGTSNAAAGAGHNRN
jgi:hypothetical protein